MDYLDKLNIIKACEMTRQFYDGFINTGFSEQQAFELTKSIMLTAIKQ